MKKAFVMLAAIVLMGHLTVACATVGSRSPQERLVVSKCGACHLVPQPGALPPERFSHFSEIHKRKVPLSIEESKVVEKYLTGQKPKE